MIFILSFGLCFFKMTLAQAPNRLDFLMVRNIGQGQWITHVRNDSCDHYDFGGEITFLARNKRSFVSDCSQKKNRLHLSHAHADHYAFLSFIIKNSKMTCWQTRAIDEIPHAPFIPDCEEPSEAQIIFYSPLGRNKNERSIVQRLNNILIPGDSSARAEKIWLQNSSLKQIEFLILGHHGSRTSTSDSLLQSLPELKLAIASSRYKTYRHPSTDVISKLEKYQISLIKTEDWGNLKINL